jgi:hypothetical protein
MENRLSLLSLLRRFRDRKASDPRDKVYALLSMVKKLSESSHLVPDYSLTVTEVFGKATLEVIYSSESLSVFSTELGRKFRADLPSWIPDWSAPGGYTYGIRANCVELYNACPGTKATPWSVATLGSSTIGVQSVRSGTVQSVGEIMWGDNVHCCRDTLNKWWHLLNNLENSETYVNSSAYGGTFVKCLHVFLARCDPPVSTKAEKH